MFINAFIYNDRLKEGCDVMLKFISENLATLIISAILLVVVVLIIIDMYKKKKSGKSISCTSSCDSCPSLCRNTLDSSTVNGEKEPN